MLRPSLLTVILLLAAVPVLAADAAWDWRDVDGVDYLSPVRNHGSCGAPYVFAPLAVIEARYRIETVRAGGSLPDPDWSEAHVLACGTGYYGAFGCNGGYARDVFEHVRDHGVAAEACLVYQQTDPPCPSACPDAGGDVILHRPVVSVGELTGFPDDAVIMQQIQDHGPVATTLDIYEDLHTYATGVYSHQTGSWVGSTVVSIVGWGEEGGTPYWICRHAWGAGWGDGGDFLVARDGAHAGCDFGEYVWWCGVDASYVSDRKHSFGQVKSFYR